MLSKLYTIAAILLVIALASYALWTSPSYTKSLEARVYYFLGNYERAYTLASESYTVDQYNKMAFTVMTQSKIAKDFEAYIKQGNEYLQRIDVISAQESFAPADRNRVKMMCEIMIESYDALNATQLTDEELQKRALQMRQKFKQLYEELF